MVLLLRIIAIFLITLFSGGAIFAAQENNAIRVSIDSNSTSQQGYDLFLAFNLNRPSSPSFNINSPREVILAVLPQELSLTAITSASENKMAKRKYRTGVKRFKNRTNRRFFFGRPFSSFVVICCDTTSDSGPKNFSFPESVLHVRKSAMCSMMPRE